MAVVEAAPRAATATRLDADERQRMILHYAPLVRQVVGRIMVMLPQAIDKEDLLGYGTVGLIEAVDRFDPTQGVRFESFAAERIRGSVIDAVRAADWIPRSSRKRGRDIQRAFLSMEEELGRAPTDQEVAAALGLTLTQLHRAMADAVSTIISLERPMRLADNEGGVTLLDCISDSAAEPGQEVEQRELRQLIFEAVERLDERERLILSLYYEQSLTLREIGQVMEISESRVWQLHARAITRIRAYIDADPRSLKKGA